ncbi:MAG: TauD/TfdA family dioxygenase [Alphaproteobacteria bacterium]
MALAAESSRVKVNRLGAALGAEALGVDLRTAGAADLAAVRQALLDHQVLAVRDQDLDPDALHRVGCAMGEPILQVASRARHPANDHVMVLSSEDRDDLGDGGRVVVGLAWHSDDSFKQRPCSVTMLHARALPSHGGDTQFVSTAAAYDDLSDDDKRACAKLRVVHTYDSRRKANRIRKLTPAEQAQVPPATHPLVRRHPETGRLALYLNANRMDHVADLSHEAGDALLDRLIAHATQPAYEYRHVWRPGDLVLWDNRCTMHRANGDYPAGERREMHRVILAGDEPRGPEAEPDAG